MENKEIRNILVENIKKELVDFAQIQKDLKKSRKLEFRPKDKSLQSIVDEIANNREKISFLIYYYRWLKHGLKYWAKQDVSDFWEYACNGTHPNGYYPVSYREKIPYWTKGKTYEQNNKLYFCEYIEDLIEKYNIKLTDNELNDFIEFAYKNI